MNRMTGLDAVADAEGFVVANPDGLQRRWNALPGEPGADDVGFLVALVDELVRRYDLDRDRVFVAGASIGAMMTYRLLCEAGDVFAAGAVVMGGPMPVAIAEACEVPGAAPLIIIHGSGDTILPWEGGVVNAGPGRTLNLLSLDETVSLWRERNQCAAEGVAKPVEDTDPTDETTSTVTRYDACESEAPVVVYRVENGGHTWPGAADSYPAFLVGATGRDFSASEVVWRFFDAQ
jgi:polyhydroxybutyrate depolymerase